MNLELQDRCAVITGAASGIGRALALHAAQLGMKLALADVDAAGLAKVAAEVNALGATVASTTLDVRRREQLDAFAADTFEQLGPVALVFANAGVMRAGTSWQLAAADWELVIDVNYKGAAHTAGVFVPYLLQQGQPAQLVFTGSTSSFLPRPHLSAYSSSKHALWGLAEALQLELAELGAPVGVSLLAPAGVRTALADPGSETNEAQRNLRQVLEAFGTPAEEIARLTFEAVRERRFWILPHPQFKDALLERAATVAEERLPRPG